MVKKSTPVSAAKKSLACLKIPNKYTPLPLAENLTKPIPDAYGGAYNNDASGDASNNNTDNTPALLEHATGNKRGPSVFKKLFDTTMLLGAIINGMPKK